MIERLFGLEWRRKRLLRKMPDSPLKTYLQTPLPPLDRDYRRVDYLSVDLELTGLDPKVDDILSIGFVPICDGRIQLGQAAHFLVRPRAPLKGETVCLHGLTDDQLAHADPLSVVLPKVLQALQGRVLLAHHVPIEFTFLNQACKAQYEQPLLVRTVDTLALEKQNREKRNQDLGGGVLRLAKVRDTYHLPRYQAHNALSDALATAELFLAQAAHRTNGKPIALRRFMV